MENPVILVESNLAWLVEILARDPKLLANTQTLLQTMGLMASELDDLQVKHGGTKSKEYLRDAFMKWIAKEGKNATFPQLQKHLKQCEFNSVAEKISEKFKTFRANWVEANVAGTTAVAGPSGATYCPNAFSFLLPQRVSSFTGRQKELQAIHSSILGQRTGGKALLAVLEGVGGVGKTTLAIEYAWTHCSDTNKFFQSIVWMNCCRERKSCLNSGFVNLAERLAVRPPRGGWKTLAPYRLAEIVYKALAEVTFGNALIIFDNLENCKELKPYIPNLHPSNPVRIPYVLITSRLTAWSERIGVIRIQMWKP